MISKTLIVIITLINFVRTQLCRDEVREFAQCSKDNGFSMVVK